MTLFINSHRLAGLSHFDKFLRWTRMTVGTKCVHLRVSGAAAQSLDWPAFSAAARDFTAVLRFKHTRITCISHATRELPAYRYPEGLSTRSIYHDTRQMKCFPMLKYVLESRSCLFTFSKQPDAWPLVYIAHLFLPGCAVSEVSCLHTPEVH